MVEVGTVAHFSIAGPTPVRRAYRSRSAVLVLGLGVLLGIAGSTPVRLAYRSRKAYRRRSLELCSVGFWFWNAKSRFSSGFFGIWSELRGSNS